ncbi:MAG: hydantoinase B/oxoprolinase family protein [Sneathiellaceae bacterium]
MTEAALDSIDLQIMWNRLVAVVEEQAQTLIRTAFSTAVREAGDLSAGVFDVDGRMIAQAVTGTPGHVNSMALAIGHFLARYPVAEMREGDVFLTNDPWMSSGHLYDFTVVTPAFHGGRLVAMFACTAHVVDIGGIGFSADGRQVYEEGLCIPVMAFARGGEVNQSLLDIVTANVREPVQVKGDLYSLAACNEIGCRRLDEMMTEFGLADLQDLAEAVITRSRDAMLAKIRALPRGTWRHSMTVDGYERPVELVAALTIGEDGIVVDYEGTSPTSGFGINVPFCYTQAYTGFGVRCIIGPDVVNNHGSLSAVTVIAPEGSIVNAPRPCAVTARHAVGQMLPDLMFGCLAQVVPGGAPAESTASLWGMPLFGGHGMGGDVAGPGKNAQPFTVMQILAGGVGARPNKDGLSVTAFPSRVRSIPIEITETISPVVFWRKELAPDSGGPGRHRGGLGQELEVGTVDGSSFTMSAATCDRVLYPARGRDGGLPGQNGSYGLASGEFFQGKGKHVIPAEGRLTMRLPGGGGYGDPAARDPASIAADLHLGLISAEAAVRDYGAVLNAAGDVDIAATSTTRQEAATSGANRT